MVSIMSVPVEKRQKVEVSKHDDGFTIHHDLDGDGRYRIVHSAYHRAIKKRRELYRLSFVSQTFAAA